jgi:opacity protein-like surface antigen
MKRLPMTSIIVVLILIGFVCPLALGQDNQVGSEEWEVQFTPYFWAADLDGDATLRGRTGSVDVGFSDILDNLDIGLMGRVEAWQGKWGVYFDGLYMDLGAEFSTPQGLVSTDIDFKMTILEFGLGHRLLETPVGQDDNQTLTFDLLGGGRYMNLEGEVDVITNGPLSGLGLAIGSTFGRREEWVDPIVGGRLRWDIDEKLAAVVRFDFGGFGIGEGLNLTWNLLAGIDYQLSKNMNLKAGYRIFDIDYDRGSGSNEFGLDAQFRGPILGLTYSF